MFTLSRKKKNYKILPTILTKHKKSRHVNLLLVQDTYIKYSAPTQHHYVWIKNLSRLLSKQLSRENGRKYLCDRCLHYFRSEEKLNNHIVDCQKINECAVKMPNEGDNILKFKNFKNKVKGPFIIYADLESILKPIDKENKYQEHSPAAVGYYVKCSYDDSLSFYRAYRGQDCMSWFAAELQQFAENVETVFSCPYDITMTSKQEEEFKKVTHCHICESPFKPEDKRVRDHNHLIPENNYRGISHESCNINYKDGHIIPVIFHNLSGYDAHFIITDIATRMGGKIDLLPITKEKYISFTKHIDESTIKFRFIDSYRFMNSPLDKLASYLKDFPNVKSQFPNISKENFNILTKKGVMPYDYIDSIEKFDETALPSIEQFYNKLNDKKCSRKSYSRAHEVWNKFNCNNLGEYVDLYMQIDILLLAEVYEQFRYSCMETYGLDPSHYFTLPGYTWDCMLKHTNQELELLTDIDKFLFIERGIRGGLSQICSKRRAHANNQYTPNYNPVKPETYLMYYDVNNQYGWAMSQALPYGGFNWVSDVNIDVTSIPDDSPEGYILEVDLQYPQQFHDIHKDLPFCPEHIDPKTGNPPTTATQMTKLMATLKSKHKYIIHYRALKQALKHGLKLTKIHRALKFKQSTWLKKYIDLNTEHRKNAKNDFEKNLFKLMNNAVFGKTMENIRKRVNIKLITKWEGRYSAEALISKPEFKSCTIFKDNLVAIELKKLQILLNKPIYVGMSVLDLAKSTLYDFHYDYMLPNFQQCNLLYTDTDSLIYEIHNQDPYEIMKRDCNQYFDTSDYPEDNIYNIPRVNKKVLGKMTDENSGVPMTDYIGLRAKLYTIKSVTTKDEIEMLRTQLLEQDFDDDEIKEIILNYNTVKKAKGVKKLVVQTKITYEDYVKCLENYIEKRVHQNLIQSHKHNVHSITQQKTALSPYDDKRYLIPETYETLPWGHYKINATQSSTNTEKRKYSSSDSITSRYKKSRSE